MVDAAQPLRDQLRTLDTSVKYKHAQVVGMKWTAGSDLMVRVHAPSPWSVKRWKAWVHLTFAVINLIMDVVLVTPPPSACSSYSFAFLL